MLVLVRHGQTPANAQGLLVGRMDPGLDEVGRRQAATLAQVDAVRTARRVVCSPLSRCRATAAAIAAASLAGATVEVDERWIELDYGDFDGLRVSDVPPESWRAWRADPTWAPPGGESLADLGRRVREACADLAAEAAASDVVVVSHVSPIKAAVAWALGVGDEVSWRLHLDVASITRISVRPTGPSVVTFNETDHLTPG